ncbi:response regulator [Clostridium luticellarii]|jgi:DNA-binding response OmpR family regulator|uniref:Stage 0 sporulation protein A homolog n=1 Tax=Clostridium luticellarii TaxID=1691940 RepID=A0A2T0BG80_9CLOT|nr:response regulator [Clostridium luticellarii]MCI1944864.1 response regulator [Clostridium luticellarii]MCI1968320.1 response regulator [Clostridium luticellarii]MCI1995318.1 response regulator [Clostridium luticellarii]MCI2039420.1 response regulator [Clostridium luticellarii]PRR82879.1 Chemotaxis protein CheY [Clostridium luticellarii]
MYKVIILDDMAYIRYRVKDILKEMDIEVYESATSFDFFNKLHDKKDEINLIILEVGLSNEDGFEVLRKIKARNLNIPIMILTKINTRSTFIKCIKEGTSEYILKPFDKKILLERTSRLVKSSKNKDEKGEIIYLNFQQYITKQIDKAKVESTKLSVIMLSLMKKYFTAMDEKIDVKDNYLILMDSLYEKLRTVFKVKDLFEKYGFSTLVGVLPQCAKDQALVTINKINEIYDTIRSADEKYAEYHLEYSCVTFPEDGENKQQLLDKLTSNMRGKVN